MDTSCRPNSPVLVSEFWPGWFDHWFEPNHNILSEADFRVILGNIFGASLIISEIWSNANNAGWTIFSDSPRAANASVNFYMFHGGTNFGFMNGANILGYSGTIYYFL